MRRPIVAAVVVGAGAVALATSFAMARRSAVSVQTGDVAREVAQLRQEIAELKGAVDEVGRAVAVGNERIASLTLTALAAAPPAASCPCAGPHKPDDSAARAEVDPENPHMREAEAVVDASLARGVWTEQDVMRFRELASAASQLDWLPLMQRMDQAINDGRLRPDLSCAASTDRVVRIRRK